MNNFIVPAAFVVAIILSFIFGAAFGGKGFWRGFILLFLILFLVGWSSQLWITPFGPIWWGVSWLPLIFVALIFSLLMIAFTQKIDGFFPESRDKNNSGSSGVTIGIFFWFLVVMLVTSVALGYYKLTSGGM